MNLYPFLVSTSVPTLPTHRTRSWLTAWQARPSSIGDGGTRRSSQGLSRRSRSGCSSSSTFQTLLVGLAYERNHSLLIVCSSCESVGSYSYLLTESHNTYRTVTLGITHPFIPSLPRPFNFIHLFAATTLCTYSSILMLASSMCCSYCALLSRTHTINPRTG